MKKSAIKKDSKKITFHVITLFPEVFSAYVNESIIGRAIKNKQIAIKFYKLRDYVKGKKYKKKWPDGNVTTYVDDRPFGGGPGMVLRAEPFLEAFEAAKKNATKRNTKPKIHVVFFSPSGDQFDTTMAAGYAKKYTDVVFLCGRYEGIDARAAQILKAQHVSVGPYVVTGGELPAMICIDSIARQIPGVLGNFDSREEARVSSSEVYTRPDVLVWKNKKYKVPEILKNGHRAKIEEWKQKGK